MFVCLQCCCGIQVVGSMVMSTNPIPIIQDCQSMGANKPLRLVVVKKKRSWICKFAQGLDNSRTAADNCFLVYTDISLLSRSLSPLNARAS